MRKYIFLLILLAYTFSKAGIEKTSKSKIEKVTVYLNGAQVTRTASISIGQGTTIIVLDDLEAGIDPSSIQASGNGNFILLDVKHKVKYPDSNSGSKTYSKNEKEIRLLEDSLLAVDYELEDNANKKEVLTNEKNLLSTNKIIRGESRNDTLPQFKDALSFYRERLNNIHAELLKLKKENYRLSQKRNRIQLNLDAMRNAEHQSATRQRPSANYQVHLTVSSDATSNATINVSYLLQNAGWTPSYDLRTISGSDKIQLTYKANVYQSTGVDWNDVKLSLSTSNPRQSNIRPILSTYFINYFQAYTRNKAKKESRELDELSKAEYIMQNAPASTTVTVDAKTTADYTTMEEKIMNYEYSIKLPYTIPSDGQTHLVSVQNKDIKSTYEHYAVPKLDNNAFLLARLSDWDDLNLIPGTANVFFEGTYVGETYIDPASTNDTLELSVGRDKSIVMTRTKLKDKTREKILGEDKSQTVTYEITIRNTKSTPIKLVLEDQIPVSQNKEIKVELKDGNGAKLNEFNGKLTWDFELKPKETRKIRFCYEVKHPKDKVLSSLN